MEIEKIYFDDLTYIWKTKLNLFSKKNEILEECDILFRKLNDVVSFDNYTIFNANPINSRNEYIVENILDELIYNGIKICEEIYNQDHKKKYNKINIDAWVNVIRSKNPIQNNFYNGLFFNKYHSHTELNEKNKTFVPDYTYVYYIQMPDVMHQNDGVLYLKGGETEHWIRPKEDELIVMNGYLPHSPAPALNSNKDRIVLAGNVGFEYSKKTKTIL